MTSIPEKVKMKSAVLAAVSFACAVMLTCAVIPAASATPAFAAEGDLGMTAAATSEQNSTTKIPKAQAKAFKKSSADFSLDLFKRCVKAKSANSNVTIAPMSVMNALALTANGAVGETSAELRRVLGKGASIATLNENLRWYNSKLANVDKARVNVANSIWYHNDGTLKMKRKFVQAAERYYSAEIAPVDFSIPATVDAINSWVADNTDNMIKKVIDRLAPDERIAIVNALSLDAEWLVPYEKSDVSPAKFTNAKGKARKVDMMYGTEHSYIEGQNVTGFIKPYAKGYSFAAMLPKEGTSLGHLVASLDGTAFRKLIGSAQRVTVHTGLPKFSLAYSNEDMAGQLADMGIARAFSDSADFSKMATDERGGLSIGRVVHKTKVDLDEQGTKAAAVTAIVMKANSAFDPDAKTVVLNRPFAYAIIDNATKLPVFIGTVSNIGK